MKKELPQCSVEGCPDAAGIIMNGTLLCGQHANEALERRRADLGIGRPAKLIDQP